MISSYTEKEEKGREKDGVHEIAVSRGLKTEKEAGVPGRERKIICNASLVE